jgi:PPK2 family polyphosphate:nucleotide phosphotransferase
MKLDPRDYIVDGKTKLKLAKRPTDLKPFYESIDDYEKQFEKLKGNIANLQECLYTEGRHGVLILLQGMDASGKDSIVKHTMSCMNPLGVQVTAFSRPSEEERKHDFLWRTHAKMPPRGKVGIFNRSYYEEVLTVRVHSETLESQSLPPEYITPEFWKCRLNDIANHEEYLERQGFEIIKIFLHVSQETQLKRLLERLNDPAKNYKVDPKDFEERKLWDKYREYYEDCMTRTSTGNTPWYIIPADDKKNARLIMANILLKRLEAMPLQLPEIPKDTKKQFDKMRKALEKSGA